MSFLSGVVVDPKSQSSMLIKHSESVRPLESHAGSLPHSEHSRWTWRIGANSIISCIININATARSFYGQILAFVGGRMDPRHGNQRKSGREYVCFERETKEKKWWFELWRRRWIGVGTEFLWRSSFRKGECGWGWYLMFEIWISSVERETLVCGCLSSLVAYTITPVGPPSFMPPSMTYLFSSSLSANPLGRILTPSSFFFLFRLLIKSLLCTSLAYHPIA